MCIFFPGFLFSCDAFIEHLESFSFSLNNLKDIEIICFMIRFIILSILWSVLEILIFLENPAFYTG